MENEVIFKNDLTKIFGERQWKSYEEEQLIKLDKEKEAFIELDGAPKDPGELYVNGDLVARGEVVTVGSDFGMRIAEVIS